MSLDPSELDDFGLDDDVAPLHQSINQSGGKNPLPQNVLALTLPIAGLLLAFFGGVLGIFFSLAGLSVSRQGLKMAEENPNRYSDGSIAVCKAAYILSWVVLGISILIFLWVIYNNIVLERRILTPFNFYNPNDPLL